MNNQDKDNDNNIIDRMLGFVAGFILLGILGAIIGFVNLSGGLFGPESSIAQLLPFTLGFGISGGVFSYFFPTPAMIMTFSGFNN